MTNLLDFAIEPCNCRALESAARFLVGTVSGRRVFWQVRFLVGAFFREKAKLGAGVEVVKQLLCCWDTSPSVSDETARSCVMRTRMGT